MTTSVHPLAPQHLPPFIQIPGSPDYFLIGMGVFLIAFVFVLGLLYMRLHALPDTIAHKSGKIQYQVVCVLGLLAMFTHVQAFRIAGLLLAFIDILDLSTPFKRMSLALDTLADKRSKMEEEQPAIALHDRESTILRLPTLAKSEQRTP